MIEDAPAGIQSARAAGTKIVGLMSTYAAEALQQADAVIGKFGQIQVTRNGMGTLAIEIR